MNLVVYDAKRTSSLINLVTYYFSLLPRSKPYPIPHETLISPFDNYAGKIIQYKCSSCSKYLNMFWEMPKLDTNPRYAISDFISRYVGCTGRGSIIGYLQSLNLAIGIDAEFSLKSDSFYIYELNIRLTDKGFKKISYVIKTVFQSLSTFMRISENHFNKLWEDFIGVADIKFHFPTNEILYDFLE